MSETVRVYYLCAGISPRHGVPATAIQGDEAGELLFPQEIPEDLYTPGCFILPRSKKFCRMGRRIAFRVMRLGDLDVPNFFDVELRALPTNGHRFEVINVNMLANVEFSALPLTNFRAVGGAAQAAHLGPGFSLWVLQPRDREELERLALEDGLIFLGTSGSEETGGDFIDLPSLPQNPRRLTQN